MNTESISEPNSLLQSSVDNTTIDNSQIRQRLNSNNNTATYRDLVIFEERLRGNRNRLLKRKRKYESKSFM